MIEIASISVFPTLFCAWLLICLIGSLWWVLDPRRLAHLMSGVPNVVLIILFLSALIAWGTIITTGVRTLLPFLSEAETIYTGHLGEFTSQKENWSGIIGSVLSLLLVYVFYKAGKSRLKDQEKTLLSKAGQ